MSIFVIGINYKTAAISLREQIYFAPDKLALYLQDLMQRGYVQEAMLLSTCNRSELYCETENLEAVKAWFCEQAIGTISCPHALSKALYIHQDEAAVTHIMQVACGLDSMVLGEPQILGQMKDAFAESCAAGAINTSFHRLFQHIFRIAKDIRTTTAVGACPVSVVSAAMHFAKLQGCDVASANVVLLGAGETTKLLLRYLAPQLKNPITIVNRNLDNALALLQAQPGHAYKLEDLPLALSQADLVFSATGSATPIITKEMLSAVMQTRPTRDMLLIDIAVPRDVEPNVADIAQVNHYCIDDLKTIIEQNLQGREHAALKAREMIQQKSQEFMAENASYDKVAHTIRAYRGQIEEICRAELMKAKQQLYRGEDPALVLDNFAEAFVNKLLHTPSVKLRQAGVEGRFEFLRIAKQLFAIPDPEAELL